MAAPVAERLIAIGKASETPDRRQGYDSAELRLWLNDRGTKPVNSQTQTETAMSAQTGALTKDDAAIENAFGRLKDSAYRSRAYRLAVTFMASVCNRRRSRMVV